MCIRDREEKEDEQGEKEETRAGARDETAATGWDVVERDVVERVVERRAGRAAKRSGTSIEGKGRGGGVEAHAREISERTREL